MFSKISAALSPASATTQIDVIKSKPFTKLLGNAGETSVIHILEKKGFRILARNYTIRAGEIDIIATKDNLIVFVEVKTRTHITFALSQVITPSKQRKIIVTAKHFLLSNSSYDKVCRFDVALVEGQNIQYIPNAFQETRRFY